MFNAGSHNIEERLSRTNYGDVLAAQGITRSPERRGRHRRAPANGSHAVSGSKTAPRGSSIAGPNGASRSVRPPRWRPCCPASSSSTPTKSPKNADDPTSHATRRLVAADTRAGSSTWAGRSLPRRCSRTHRSSTTRLQSYCVMAHLTWRSSASGIATGGHAGAKILTAWPSLSRAITRTAHRLKSRRRHGSSLSSWGWHHPHARLRGRRHP